MTRANRDREPEPYPYAKAHVRVLPTVSRTDDESAADPEPNAEARGS
jgi:hypothetical protein